MVYSAYNVELQINGEAMLRANANVRVTGLKVTSKTNGAFETYNCSYSKDITNLYATLPSNASITYEVTITNKTSKDYEVAKILESVKNNSNITVTVGVSEGSLLDKNASKKFIITLTNNTSSTQVGTVVYQYRFEETLSSYVLGNYSTPNAYTVTIPYTGEYKIELWGAQGGTSTAVGGKGGYTSGNIILNANTTLYVYVGGQGAKSSVSSTYTSGGYNGGGGAHWGAASGGGATDVRLTGGNWNDFNSLKSRIMVAGAGGGGLNFDSRGAGSYAGGLTAGDTIGYSGTTVSNTAATQTKGGVHTTGYGSTVIQGTDGGFGTGGQGGSESQFKHGSGGGGAGYYGGSGGSARDYGGSGGSSFISGYSGCNAINSSSTSSNITHSGQANHYSGYKFTDAKMIAGNASMTSPTGSTEIGHAGNGYARITFIKKTY